MKRILLSLITILMLMGYGFSQVPEAFNYQAVVRNSSSELIANQSVSFKISIVQNTAEGTVVYVETHSVTTNDFGLANLIIGQGTVLEGVFSPGGWGMAPHFIKVELDPEGGSSYTHIGTSQLLSVPYAFHANTVSEDEVNDADADPANELQTIQLSGDELTLSEGGGTVVLPSGGSSLWAESGDDIYRSSGNVGIGTTNTGTARMHINMNSSVPNPHILLKEEGSDYARLSFENTANPGKYWTWAGMTRPDDKDSKMNLWYYNGTSGKDLFSVSGDGNIVLSGELHSDNTGANNMMPFAYGYILSAGTKEGCTSNVGTVSKLNTGQYRVNISGLGTGYTVVITPNQGVAYLTGVVSGRDPNYFVVAIWNTKDDIYRDGGFSFIVYKP